MEVKAKPNVVAKSDIEVIQSRIQRLLRRAFRRPVDKETLARFTKFADEQLKSGGSLDGTMRTIVGAVLGMPDFLYYYETPGVKNSENGPSQQVNDFELASRLAQFFWSS